MYVNIYRKIMLLADLERAVYQANGAATPLLSLE